MTVICLGPCCIPVSALLPLLLIFIAPILNLLRKTPLAKYLPDPDAKTKTAGSRSSPGAGCCSDAACKGDGEGDVLVVGSIQQWEDLKRSEPLLIADFTAGWCGPCRKIGPVFERLAVAHKGAASFVKVDIDDLPDAFDGISIPAFHVIRNGEKIDSLSGAVEARLRTMVAKHCEKGDSTAGKTTKTS